MNDETARSNTTLSPAQRRVLELLDQGAITLEDMPGKWRRTYGTTLMALWYQGKITALKEHPKIPTRITGWKK